MCSYKDGTEQCKIDCELTVRRSTAGRGKIGKPIDGEEIETTGYHHREHDRQEQCHRRSVVAVFHQLEKLGVYPSVCRKLRMERSGHEFSLPDEHGIVTFRC